MLWGTARSLYRWPKLCYFARASRTDVLHDKDIQYQDTYHQPNLCVSCYHQIETSMDGYRQHDYGNVIRHWKDRDPWLVHRRYESTIVNH